MVVNESLISKIRVEDHCHLLCCVKRPRTQVNISNTSVMHKCKHRLNKANTETLRGVAHELLSHLRVNSQQTQFYTNLQKNSNARRRELVPSLLRQIDFATARRCKQTVNSKRLREEFNDVVELKMTRKR